MAEGRLGEFEELVLLGTLRLGRDAYGLEIQREIAGRTNRDVSYGAVYSALNRLEEKRFVSSRAEATSTKRGGRARRFFTVADRGINALKEAQRVREELSKGATELVDPMERDLSKISTHGRQRVPFKFEDARQTRVHARLLHLLGPGPASFFRDACMLMRTDTGMNTTTHLVGHLLREIESAVRDVVEGASARDQEVVQPTVRGTSHENEIRAILRFLDIPESDPLSEAWRMMTGRGEGRGLHGHAHRWSLFMPRPVNWEFIEFWDTMQGILDQVLEKLEDRFLEFASVLDDLVAKDTPSERDVRTLRQHVPNNLVTLHYFFERLDKPGWLTPLHRAGYFDLDALGVDSGETLKWPQFGYLARMVERPEVQEEAFNIVLATAKVENHFIADDLADAALALPPKLSSQIVPHAKKWLNLRSPLLPRKVGELIKHFALNGELESASELTRSLFSLEPDSRRTSSEGFNFGLRPRPQSFFSSWEYNNLLEECTPNLVDATGFSAIEALCDLLEDAIRLSLQPNEEKPEDSSNLWRPAVEERRQNQSDPKDALIDSVRKAIKRLVDTDCSLVSQIVRELESRGWSLFDRIALDLLRQFPEASPALIRERLMDRTMFENDVVRHEYNLLASVGFRSLAFEDQEVILSWIEEGPRDLESLANWYHQVYGEEPAADYLNQYTQQWKRDRLAALGEGLPCEWKERLGELVESLGEPNVGGLAVGPIRTWLGPQSPRNQEELRAMSVSELTEFLAIWEPSRKWDAPSRVGLGRDLKEVIASEPSRFAKSAFQFKGLDPTYVRSFFEGLKDGVGNGELIDWHTSLGFAQWVVKQPREIPGRSGGNLDQDPDWGATRQAIVDLLSEGFTESSVSIPFEFRPVAWKVLCPLTDDPEPTPEYEAQYGGSNMDPATLSINTTRGEAMHAVIRYALWVRRHSEGVATAATRKTPGFDEMPEVREVLETHLDSSHDPSGAVRAVYGRWFPWLVLLDPMWAAARTKQIFDIEAGEPELRKAAWDAYIGYVPPYDDVLEVLTHQYEKAVSRLTTSLESGGIESNDPETSQRPRFSDPEKRLAEHLLIYYWRGKIEIDDSTSVLSQFFERAEPNLRAHALTFVGYLLKDAEEVSSNVQDRLKALWSRRLAAARADMSGKSTDEIAAFGWWFASGRMEENWALQQLKEVLELAGKVDPDHEVADHLARIVVRRPLDAVTCLSGLVESFGEKPWMIIAIREPARAILTTALASQDHAAAREASALVNRLAARGNLEYRELLD